MVTPFTVPLSGVEDGGEGERRYLNVNLVYELWKDIKFEWLQHRWAGRGKGRGGAVWLLVRRGSGGRTA